MCVFFEKQSQGGNQLVFLKNLANLSVLISPAFYRT